MKKLLTVLLILTYTFCFSQIKDDYSHIIELVVSEYNSDSIQVYHRFDNSWLISDLKKIKSSKDMTIYKEFGYDYDVIAPKTYGDSVTVMIEKMKVVFYPNQELLKKHNKKRLNKHVGLNLKKNKRDKYAYISFPLISADSKKAIVYGGYYCGGLCGSGGIFFLTKIDGDWIISDYEQRWIA